MTGVKIRDRLRVGVRRSLRAGLGVGGVGLMVGLEVGLGSETGLSLHHVVQIIHQNSVKHLLGVRPGLDLHSETSPKAEVGASVNMPPSSRPFACSKSADVGVGPGSWLLSSSNSGAIGTRLAGGLSLIQV